MLSQHSGRNNRKRRNMIIAGIAIVALLALAWFDGGEEPIRTLVEPVTAPISGDA